MEYNDIDDNELMYMVNESSEEAKDIVYEKYKYIIDISFNKYKKVGRILKIEPNDLYQEALLGFSDAIHSYKEDEDASLATFIQLCVERRLNVAIEKAKAKKNKFITDSISIDEAYVKGGLPLKDILSDDNANNPLNNLTDEEMLNELEILASREFSSMEYAVYRLMLSDLNYNEIATLLDINPKSADNTIQRIRIKIKKFLEDRV